MKAFWKQVKITKDPDKCWEWKGSVGNHGYGLMILKRRGKKKMITAHRFSYQLTYGKIPKKAFVCHRCDNKTCVNPRHLELGNRSKNVSDAVKRGLVKKKGRLTEKAKRFIRENPYGHSQRKLASIYGVSQSRISKIVREGRSYDNSRRNGQHREDHSGSEVRGNVCLKEIQISGP